MLIEELSRATSVLSAVVGELDGEGLSGPEAAVLVERFSAICKLAGAGITICAKRVSETRYYERCGHRDAGSWLGELCGEPTGAARSLLATAGRLCDLPGLEGAMRAGELSPEQAAAVARGGAADPSLESELLERARTGSLRELRDKADKIEAAARSRQEDEARYARIQAERHLRTWLDADGSFKGRFSLTPEDGALFLAGIEQEANRLFDSARRAGLREAREAYLADALVAVVSGQQATVPAAPSSGLAGPRRSDAGAGGQEAGGQAADGGQAGRRGGGRPAATILFHVDLEALRRGSLGPGEECTVEGGGHVPLSVVQAYLDSAAIRLVVKNGGDIDSVFSCTRTIPAAIQTALSARDRTCVVPGCSSSFHLEIDHIVEFAKGGKTKLSNLCLLCRMHHAMKSQKGYRIEGGPGRWRWLAPPEPTAGAGGYGGYGDRDRDRDGSGPDRVAGDRDRDRDCDGRGGGYGDRDRDGTGRGDGDGDGYDWDGVPDAWTEDPPESDTSEQGRLLFE